MAVERQTRVFAYFEEDVVGHQLDLSIVLVLFLDGIDKLSPKLCVHGSSREARNHVEACVNAHLVCSEMESQEANNE